MNLLNVLWLTPSLKMWVSVTPRPNRFQPRSPFDFMHSRMNWSRLQLQVCGRQAQLLGSDYSIWHHVCYTSNCQVLIRSKAIAWQGNSLPDLLFEEDSWFGPTFQAWFQQGFWVLLWCRLLGAVEQGICTGGSHYFQVTKWLDHFLCRMPCLLGLQTSIPSYIVHYWSWVYCNITSSMWCHSYHGTTTDRKWGSEILRFFVPSPTCIARFLKTTQAPLNWQGFPNFALEPSTSTYATIFFANMCGRGLSKYSPLTPRIRLLMLLPSPWHKMIFNVIVTSCAASDPHKLPKWGSVTLWETLVLIL